MTWRQMVLLVKRGRFYELSNAFEWEWWREYYTRTKSGIYIKADMMFHDQMPYQIFCYRLSTPNGVTINEEPTYDPRIVKYFDPIRMEHLL